MNEVIVSSKEEFQSITLKRNNPHNPKTIIIKGDTAKRVNAIFDHDYHLERSMMLPAGSVPVFIILPTAIYFSIKSIVINRLMGWKNVNRLRNLYYKKSVSIGNEKYLANPNEIGQFRYFKNAAETEIDVHHIEELVFMLK